MLKKHYSKKYNLTACVGPTEYPSTWDELFKHVFDDWNIQIACVFAGNKPLAITYYGQLEEYDELQPKDVQLREVARQCGIGYFQDKTGTEYWYKPEFENNARLLEKIGTGNHKPPMEIYDFVYSVLLGYTDVSIIAYELFQQMSSYVYGKKYSKEELNQLYLISLPKFIKEFTPSIEQAKIWIKNQQV